MWSLVNQTNVMNVYRALSWQHRFGHCFSTHGLRSKSGLPRDLVGSPTDWFTYAITAKIKLVLMRIDVYGYIYYRLRLTVYFIGSHCPLRAFL